MTYQKGRIPWNKGKAYLPGTIILRKRAGKWKFPRRRILLENGTWKLLMVHVWEQANGLVPKGHNVIPKDGDTFNDQDLNNLKLVSTIEVSKEKQKQKAKEAEKKVEYFNTKEFYSHYIF